jgi:predicted nucleotidyltransferase component of viral defense system
MAKEHLPNKEYLPDIDISCSDEYYESAVDKKERAKEADAKNFDISTERYDRTSAKVEIVEYEIND